MAAKALVFVESAVAPVMRLLVVPQAGAGAAAAGALRRAAPQEWLVAALRLPGRESRFREPAGDLSAQVAETVAAAHSLPGDAPLVLMGTCSGAVAAFEATRALEAEGTLMPAGLVVMARRAPDRRNVGPTTVGNDDDFLADLKRLGGVPPVLEAAPDVLRAMLPTLRADFAAVSGYVADPGSNLRCPVLAIGGRSDPFSPPETLVGWAGYASISRVSQVDAGHFPLADNPHAIVACLSQNLDLFGAG